MVIKIKWWSIKSIYYLLLKPHKNQPKRKETQEKLVPILWFAIPGYFILTHLMARFYPCKGAQDALLSEFPLAPSAAPSPAVMIRITAGYHLLLHLLIPSSSSHSTIFPDTWLILYDSAQIPPTLRAFPDLPTEIELPCLCFLFFSCSQCTFTFLLSPVTDMLFLCFLLLCLWTLW